jgi:hypothetical protein
MIAGRLNKISEFQMDPLPRTRANISFGGGVRGSGLGKEFGCTAAVTYSERQGYRRRLKVRFGGRFRGLSVAFVEVEGCVELGLARQQILQARLVLEGPVGLGLIIGEGFSQPLLLLVIGSPIEGSQRLLDAFMLPIGLSAFMCAV